MDAMERLIDKAMILACAVCCAMLAAAPSAASVAMLLLAITCSALSEVLSGRLAAAAILACGLALVAEPEAAALEALVIYDVARLGMHGELWSPGAQGVSGERRGARAPWDASGPAGLPATASAIVLVLAVGSLCRLGAVGKPGLVVALAACLFGLALLLSLRTSGLLAHRRSVLDARDALAVRTRTLRARNQTLTQRLSKAQELAERAAVDKRAFFPQLTQREFEIIALVAEGLDNREIAARAFMSEGTVRNTISSALAKLQLKNRTQLAIAYLKAGTRA